MTLQIDRITDLSPESEFPPLSDFLAVGAHGCRWPGEGLECCGRMTRKHGSYCDHHAKLAYRRHMTEDAREARAENFTKLLYSHKFSKGHTTLTLPIRATAEELGL